MTGDSDRQGDRQDQGYADGGRQLGGGASPADADPVGGSSGAGGYGNAENQQHHQGSARPIERGADDGMSRGAAFDEAQGGGRGDASPDEQQAFQRDQQAHQDQGQSQVESEGEGEGEQGANA